MEKNPQTSMNIEHNHIDTHTHTHTHTYIYIRGVSKKFGEWYQKTNKTEDTNKLTLLAYKIIAILL
jgi:hypothetical protein